MKSDRAPFPDELLTSWLARQNHSVRDYAFPRPKVVVDREGRWRLPDILPPNAWLRAAAEHFGVSQTELGEITIARCDPTIPLDFLAWDKSPFQTGPEILRARPRLHISWCNRCLAEDFAAGQPAYVRRHWVLAATAFCHKHRWPLEEYCTACHSSHWRFSSSAHGPSRMICQDCWRPLERSAPETLAADRNTAECWDSVIALETEVAAALKGRTPDQFRFNFTSADQLVNEVRDLSQLLAGNHRRLARTDSPLNDFPCPAMTRGRIQPEYGSSNVPFPLAVAPLPMRRCLLAVANAIIDPRIEIGSVLVGAEKPSAIEIFVASVDCDALTRCAAHVGRWSPSFQKRIVETQRRAGSGSQTLHHRF
ncbi:TniQ family protein [Sphingomonadaceae bacterium G21617-S1]|nr:TniQ family protein [Sphingomonadaceae bacterium G21617-S1]